MLGENLGDFLPHLITVNQVSDRSLLLNLKVSIVTHFIILSLFVLLV
jgi:hypothetical protein